MKGMMAQAAIVPSLNQYAANSRLGILSAAAITKTEIAWSMALSLVMVSSSLALRLSSQTLFAFRPPIRSREAVGENDLVARLGVNALSLWPIFTDLIFVLHVGDDN